MKTYELIMMVYEGQNTLENGYPLTIDTENRKTLSVRLKEVKKDVLKKGVYKVQFINISERK